MKICGRVTKYFLLVPCHGCSFNYSFQRQNRVDAVTMGNAQQVRTRQYCVIIPLMLNIYATQLFSKNIFVIK